MSRRRRQPFEPVEVWGLDEPYLRTTEDGYAYVEGEIVFRLTEKAWKQLRKPTGIAYYGTDPGYFDGWIYDNADPFAPIAHTDWEMAAFQEGGWAQ